MKNTKHKYTGIYGRDYHETRLNHPTVKFSLNARAGALSTAIKEVFPQKIKTLLDIGSADGLLASGINNKIPYINNIICLDLDINLLGHNPFPSSQADSCHMPFADNSVDIITAAALIEHLYEPMSFLKECHRVIRPKGGLFLTCPAPFFEWLATKLGYLKDAGHVARYDLRNLATMCENAHFSVVLKRKFMPAPFPLPGGMLTEKVMRRTGFSFLMLNQVIGVINS